ncbi:uncharacterized protein LOC120353691 [Nilaparvata lugens]|uniref:uncharacterized protein LOC120353691 n=1 Tax=Nilaparvata lugens TaxID=108931 RepID=UPI00193E1615|nr:uncharacterized protein LOC120353691 [Nilaparvata lugens]
MISLSKLALIVFYLIADLYAVSILNDLGPNYDVVFYKFEQCDKRGKVDFLSNLKVGKLNRTHHIYTGIMDTGADVDNKLKVQVIAAVKSSSGRYSTLIDMKLKACDMVMTFGRDIFQSLADNCNETLVCPKKRTRCDLKDFIINFNFNNLPVMPYGDYRVEVILLKMLPYAMEEKISCLMVFGGVVKRQSNPRSKNKKNMN